MYRGLSILFHVAMKFALVGSPKTAAPVCVLTRRLGGGDCFCKDPYSLMRLALT